jgi:hypothetical protein
MKAMAGKSLARKALKYGFLSLIGTAILVFSLELVLRWSLGSNSAANAPGCLMYGTSTVFSYRPGCEEVISGNQGEATKYAYNQLGLRESARLPSSRNPVRVLLLGDCFLENRSLPNELALENLVREKLAARGVEAVVYNGGQGATSLWRDWVRLSEILPRQKVHHVFYGFGGESLANSLIHRRYIQRESGPRLEIKNPLDTLFGREIFLGVLARTSLPRLFHHLWYFTHYLRLRLVMSPEAVTEESQEALTAIERLVRESGAKFSAQYIRSGDGSVPKIVLNNSSFFKWSGFQVFIRRLNLYEKLESGGIKLKLFSVVDKEEKGVGVTTARDAEALAERIVGEILKKP